MGLILSASIALARTVLNDTEEDYRYSDADLLEYGNGALRSLADVRPEWFISQLTHTCIAGARQTLDPGLSHRLIRVIGLHHADRDSLDAFSPAWRDGTEGDATNWLEIPGSALEFELYPPSEAAQVVKVEHVAVPGPYAADDDTGLPDTLREAVADYMVGMAEARDDEHVLAQRSAQFIAQFLARVGGTQSSAKG